MTPGEILIPALINGALTVLVFLASMRSLRAGFAACLASMALGLLALWVWSTPRPRPAEDTTLALLATCLATVALTFLPGAVLAMIAGRLDGRRRFIAAMASECVALFLGVYFMVILLTCTCGILGDCL